MPWRKKNKNIKHKFHALAPIDSAELGIYESALDFVFLNNKVKNVAVSGAYGAGKSSVIESYKNNHPRKKFVHISLTRFRSEVEDTEDDESRTSDTILEGKILNQLIHQIPEKRIPRTNFRVKKNSSKPRNIITSILAVVVLMLGMYLFRFSRWVYFVDALNWEWLKARLHFSTYTEVQFITGILLLITIGILVYRVVKIQELHSIVKKASVSGLEIEIFKDGDDSYFDKYLNEVLYLFNEIKADAIIFEDIDRYDSSRIFERLHEINRLVNSNCKRKFLWFFKCKPLRFIFLLKDDMFTSKDRTKFFDFIIPVVPVIDGSNSFDKFLDYFKKIGITVSGKHDDNSDGKLCMEFLQGISLYVDDMRLLQNICNEFAIYHERIITTEQDENKMFALITYKNIFPRDFAELQLGQGFIFEIIGCEGINRLTENEHNKINSVIGQKNIELESVKAELSEADELTIIYGHKLATIQRRNGYQTSESYIQLLNSYRGYGNTYGEVVDEYDRRVTSAGNSTESRENRISRIEKELLNLNHKRTILAEKPL